jgi:hypothetical protein
MASLTDSLLPLGTFLLGYGGKSLSDWLLHRRTMERDREAREVARRDQLLERRNAFQRQTLLDLQDALMLLGRTYGQMHHQDVMTYKQTGEWQKHKFPGDLAEESRATQSHTSVLVSRVRDENVRELVQKFKDYGVSTLQCANRELGDRAMLLMATTSNEVNQRIGEILRKMDDEAV